jgi:hypothetical protein
MAWSRRIAFMPDQDDNARTELKQQDTTFHYSRERRLNRASPEVRALNDGKHARPTLRKILFGNRANIMLFISIIVISVFGLAINYFNRDNRETSPGSTTRLGENHLSLVILRFEQTLILTIVKDAPESGEVYIGEVDIAVSPVMPRLSEAETEEEITVFSHRIFFGPVDSETFRITIPFEGEDFFVILRADEEQRSVRLRAVEVD